MARRLAELETPASIWHVTDEPGGNDEARMTSDEEAESDVAIEHFCVALERPINVGVTAFQLRRPAMERSQFDAFVQIHCASSTGKDEEPVDAKLEVYVDGTPRQIRELTLQPGGREKLLVKLDVPREADQVLTLKVIADGDVLPLDDVVHARLPRLRATRVLWISESPDPFTELALTSVGSGVDLDVLQGPPSAWSSSSKRDFDVAIFDNWLPEKWPADVPVIVINPPGSLGPIEAARIQRGGMPLESVRAPDPQHPLLYGVATGRVALTQTAVIEAGGTLESVWVGLQGPVLAAGEDRGQRVVVMGFSPQLSEQLPLMASYPLLIGNAVYWAATAEVEAAEGMNCRTGQLVQLEGTALTWRDTADNNTAIASVELAGRPVELDRIGLWETDAGQLGSAALLSTQDTLLPSRATNAGSEAEPSNGRSPFRGDMAPILLWGILGLLLLESWLFHRYWAY